MKFSILSILLLCGTLTASAQSRSDIFSQEVPMTWLGLDFSRAKLIGDRERLGSESDIRRTMETWNNIFEKEKDKFNIARALHRKDVPYALEVTNDHNQQLDVLSLYTDDKSQLERLKLSDIDEIVADYDFSGMSGIGFMFIVESFSKLDEKAVVWPTFINLQTKEVLLTEKFYGDPGGFSLKSFWANACFVVLERIQKKEYPKWNKLYGQNKKQ